MSEKIYKQCENENKLMPMKNGIITLDSEVGKEIGFLSSKFDGYLWKKGNTIIISFIASKARGNFRQLVKTLLDKGFTIDIPTPVGQMQDIVLRNGYKHRIMYDKVMGPVDIWSLRKQLEPDSEECSDPWHDAVSETGVPGTKCPTCGM